MPVEFKGNFCRRRVADPAEFAKGSLRTVTRGKTRIIIGCPKGAWDPRGRVAGAKFPGRCRVGTKAQAILTPPVKGRCPAR